MDVGVAILNIGHEPDAFPELDTASTGIDGHDARGSKCPFEQGMSNFAPYTGPTESGADIEAPHPQRFWDNGVNRDPAYSSQEAC
jgi:hypothetical protein